MPPRILNLAFQNLNACVDSNWSAWVDPIEIKAPKAVVWGLILNFDSYTEWNPFHRQVKVVADSGGRRFVRMWVNFGAHHLDGLIPVSQSSPLSDERILYVDDRPKYSIIIYGLDWFSVPTMRVQVLEAIDDVTCRLYSYDHFGSWLGLILLKLPLQNKFRRLFTLAAEGLKRRAESDFKGTSRY